MRKIAPLALLLATVGACSSPGRVDEQSAMPTLGLGFNPTELDADTRAQDDFYDHVNGIWIANTPIPEERTRYGSATILFEQTERQVRALIEQADAPEQRQIRDLYASFMNETAVDELGTQPLAAELERIAALTSYAQIIDHMARALTMGIQVPLDFYIDADAANTDRSLVYFWQDGLGLPDRDYYLSDNENLNEVADQYAEHIARMYDVAGWRNGEQAAAAITRIERRIATSHWSRVQNRDRERIYSSKYSLSAAGELSEQFDWAAFLKQSGFGEPEQFIIAQSDYFAELGKIISEFPVAQWREYLRFKTLKAYAPYLNAALLEENFDFQGRILRGQQKMQPRWKRGVRLVNRSLGEAVGQAYVEAHFPPESKVRVDQMIENLRSAFGEAIRELDWMSDETKSRAGKKLALFTSKIGYPSQWRDYSNLNVAPDDLVGNVRRAREFEHFRQVAKLSKPVDRTEWGMTPQTVNAYYRPTMNEIVFPAAILQPPFFDPRADDAVNYGAIGSVIGHEFSHGFDDQGRKFGGDGRLADWWTEDDAAEYVARTKVLIDQYNEFKPLPDQAVNGELTLGENIADLAGLVVAYRAWQFSLDGKAAPTIDGYSGDERFFIGYALGWRGKFREQYLREILLSDPHSPYRYRVTGVLRNMQAFYDTYDLQPGDGMYLPPENRVKIW